ncbi:unnamed protein product [Cylindrotheca closterium]|uniref:Uncharacterized protein n=1 Tax=Cylindrotheca closterium TaxID=2856 RepID=A0AAD2CKX1_9STRA|nr:unnamed protein product [Cylindrotheca closterium]
MNWCGLGNYAEPEMVELNISDDRFKGVGSSSMKKKSSSQLESRRKSDGGSRRERSTYSQSSSKGRSSSSKGRQSPSYMNPVESRTSSKPPKAACVQKLEKGFNVVMITDDSAVNVKLDLDPKNPHIRIRPLDENAFERNRSSMETQFRLQDIARLEVGRDKTENKTSKSKKPVRLFSVMLRSRSKQYRSFNFEAESVSDRDTIIEAIKTLLEQARSLSSKQKRKTQTQSSHVRSSVDIELNPRKSTIERQNASEHERKATLETRNDSYSTASVSRSSSDASSREEALSARSSKSGSGSKRSGHSSGTGRSRGSRSSRTMADEDAFRKNSKGVVEDKELAAKFENHQAAPWCTDDICSAGFKEFNATVTGIFGENPALTNGSKYSRPSGASRSMTSLLWNTTKSDRRKHRLQNRAANPSSKARRWKNLRNQMTFEAADLENDIPYLKTVQSCDDFDKSRETLKATPPSNPFSKKRHNNEDDVELYYDSDPEDAREVTFRRLGARGVQAAKANKIKDDSVLGRTRQTTASMTPLYNRKMKKVDDTLILDIIENLKNQKLTLLWHPEQTKDGPNQAPVCVKVWIESGIYLVDGTFLLPKLTWLPVHEANASNFVMNAAIQNPEAVDMLDVCRVRECDSIDRKLYPYADVNRSFIVQTQSGSTLFETRFKQERGHMVNGLKLVIARLASLLMLRDLRAVEEFFGGNSTVPGEAPWWAKASAEESEAAEGGMPALP